MADEPTPIGGSAEEIQERINLERELLRAQIQYLETIGQTAEVMKTRIGLQDELFEKEQAQAKLLDQINDAVLAGNEAQADGFRTQLANLQEVIIQQKALNESLDIGAKAATDFSKAIFGVGGAPNTALGKLAASAMKAKDSTEALEMAGKAFSDGVADTFSRFNLVVSAADKLVEGIVLVGLATKKLVLEQDQLISTFNRTMGFTGQFNTELENLSMSLLRAGVSQGDVINSSQALFNALKNFPEVTEEVRSEVIKTTAALSRLGFSAEAQADNILFLSSSFGIAEEEAARFNTGLNSLADSMNIPIKDIAEAFKQAQPVLAATADDIIELEEQFRGLTAVMKTTDLGMRQILDVTQGFDTFDEASDRVGRLNAILGGPFLSTLELVREEDPTQRFILLRGALDDAGLAFESLTRRQKQMLAETIPGLNDVNDLSKLMKGNIEALVPSEIEQQSLQELQDNLETVNSITERLTNAFVGFVASLEPAILLVEGLLSSLVFVVESLSNFFSSGIGQAVLGIVAAGAVVTLLPAIGAAAGALAPILPLLLALGGFTAVGAAMGPPTEVQDGFIEPGRPVVKSGAGELIVGQKEDSIAIGTNLTSMSATGPKLMAASMNDRLSNLESRVAGGGPSMGPIQLHAEIKIGNETIEKTVNNTKIAYNGRLYNSMADILNKGSDLSLG